MAEVDDFAVSGMLAADEAEADPGTMIKQLLRVRHLVLRHPSTTTPEYYYTLVLLPYHYYTRVLPLY